MKRTLAIAIGIAIAVIVTGTVYFSINENTIKNPTQAVPGSVKPKNYTISLSETVGIKNIP